VYLHREPHSSGPYDTQLVYEDMPQESGSYQCKRICKQIRDMLEIVAGAVRKSKSDIVLSTLAVSQYTE